MATESTLFHFPKTIQGEVFSHGHKDGQEEIFLGVETSCDETALALLRGREVLGHEIYSQHHEGGVIPSLAARGHQDILPHLAKNLEKNTGILLNTVQGIGVTTGPGLLGGLLAGSLWAQGLALSPLFHGGSAIPLWPVHHLGAHGLVSRLNDEVKFPFVLLLLSGGHCLVLMAQGPQKFYRLGQSLDDAPGECLDKVARFMVGKYPGGPFIEEWAKKGQPSIALPVPLEGRQQCVFSFSGLKTAAIQWLQKYKDHLPHSSVKSFPNDPLASSDKKTLNNAPNLGLDHKGNFIMEEHPILWDFCASLQRAIGKTLHRGLQEAFGFLRENSIANPWTENQNNNCHNVVIPVVMAGGVASNMYLRSVIQKTCEDNNAKLYCPPPSLCTDNGIMVAWAAQEYKNANISPSDFVFCDPAWTIDDYGRKNKGMQ